MRPQPGSICLGWVVERSTDTSPAISGGQCSTTLDAACFADVWGGAPQEDGSEGDDASPASRVRQRYERLFQAREREHDSPRAAAAAAAEALAADTAARSAFQGAISSAFVPHLGCAVACRPGPPSPAYESFGWRTGASLTRLLHRPAGLCMWQP